MTEDITNLPWSEPDWSDRIRLGGGERSPTAAERYGTDYDWLRRWTLYAEVMWAVARIEVTDGTVPISVLEEMGAPQRALYAELDIGRAGSGSVLGRKLYAIIADTLTTLYEREGLDPSAREAIHAWHHMLHRDRKSAARSWKDSTGSQVSDAVRSITDRMWHEGLHKPSKFQAGPAEGLRMITAELDGKMAPWRRLPVESRDDVDTFDQYLDAILPDELAKKIRDGAQRMKDYRATHEKTGVTNLGIDERGRPELLARVVPQLARRFAGRESMLLLGPTSSGKSHVGRIAVCYAVERLPGGRAVVLLPTKALVTQAVNEWKDFLKDTKRAEWRILAGSRDYPQHDEAFIRGEFEVGVMIPEKLAGLMANGMTLRSCGLLVVDELQHLADQQRGPRLEMLLTGIRDEYPDMSIMGLSATLTSGSAEAIRTWLKIDASAVIRADRRPVPLDMLACDERRIRVLQADGQVVERSHDLDGVVTRWESDPRLRKLLRPVRGYDRALALAVALLGRNSADADIEPVPDGPGHSVLCFVGSRDNAEQMAAAARVALQLDPRIPRLNNAEDNPFLGRFSRLDPEQARGRRRELERFPDTPLRHAVAEALRTGVGFHTARLEQPLRILVEEAFREGMIRLLFATDTLKLGLNLPADAVVVGSLTTPIGRRRHRVLDRDAAHQRIGRAGRLGFSTRGQGYLVVPRETPRKAKIEFDEADLDGLAEMSPANYDGEPNLERALRALGDVDKVFDYYLRWEQSGTAIESGLTDEWFARLLLQTICRDSPRMTMDQLTQRVTALFQVSLAAVGPAAQPDPHTVVGVLRDRHLIGPSPHSPGHLTITGLGRAISTSGMPFADAEKIQELAFAVQNGAGELTLLWLALQTDHVQRTFDWIAIVPPEHDETSENKLKRCLISLAAVFAAAPADRARLAEVLPDNGFLDYLPGEDLLGDGPEAVTLRTLLTTPQPDPGLDVLNALLRACVLVLWMHGCPLDTIERAVRSNVSVRYAERGEDRVRDVVIHLSDVRSLGENASYVFDAGAELMGVRPEGTAFRRLESISEAVQLGVPAPLAPLARLNLRATHRERIVHLVRSLHLPFDSLADLVDEFLTRPAKAPANMEWRRRLKALMLTDAERAEIRKLLEDQESRRRGRIAQFPEAFRNVPVPGLGYGFGQPADELCSPHVGEPVGGFVRIMRACGIDAVRTGDDDVLLRSRVDERTRARMTVRRGRVTAQQMTELRGTADIVVAVNGLTDGAAATAITPDRPATVVLEPAILLEAMVRLIGAMDERLSTRHGMPSDDAEDWQGDWDDDEDDQLLGGGFEEVGDQIIRLLTAAPPVLKRVDLNRLIAGLSVAAPPPLTAHPRAAGDLISEEPS